MKEDDNKEKNLTQLEIDNVIDKTINLSIILKLLKINAAAAMGAVRPVSRRNWK